MKRSSGRTGKAGGKRKKRLLAGAVLAALALALPQTSRAVETQVVSGSSGNAYLELKIYGAGESLDGGTNPSLTSLRDLSAVERQALVRAGELWADITASHSPAVRAGQVHVLTSNDYNASALGLTTAVDGIARPVMLSLTAYGETPEMPAGLVFVGLGISETSPWTVASHLSALPYTKDADLVSVIFHEYGHMLGINSTVDKTTGAVDGTLSVWDIHLRDRNGTSLESGMTVVKTELSESSADETVFHAGTGALSGVTFHGEHVSEVLQGALGDGVPVNGFDRSGSCDLSHLELAHSMMSHQNWRNWTTFMEAELAVMQDLGYVLDRRNWFGHSVYGSGLTLTNTNGYWARNDEGTAYIAGQANTAALGLGLHVYGSNNTITQAADLMACGTAGTGIRVDGTGNTLVVAEDVLVAADGAYGTGLLVSYGKEQTVASRGTITAAGEGGIAVRFDFGQNMLGSEVETRGSWIWGVVENGQWSNLNIALGTDLSGMDLNLDGPMVSRFTLSGTLQGSAAAICIADNAYVERIDVLSGASITGDIVSEWSVEDSRIQYAGITGNSNTDLATLVTFGLAAGKDGTASDTADPGFAMTYDGNISGAKSLRIQVAGGTLEYNGAASVLEVTVDEGATLSGAGSWSLNAIGNGTSAVGGTFTNSGTYAPGSGLAAGDGADIAAVSIDGSYAQTETGTLQLSFTGSGATDTLRVTGVASLAGTVALAPVRDYYAGGDIALALSDLVRADTLALSESLASDILAASPTLTMALTAESTASDAAYTISTSRAADAYSRYAASGQQADLARNLDGLGQTDLTSDSGDLGDARNLLTALDFSASDGSDLPGAYSQLGPDSYTKAGQASLSLQRSLTSQIVNGRLFSQASGQAGGSAAGSGAGAQAMAAGDEQGSAGSTRVFATPMGGRNVSFSSGGSDTSYYGLLAGAETDLALGRDSLTLGVHAAFLHTEGSARTNDEITGDNISLGLHGRWDPDLSLDAGALGTVSPYVYGLVRGGMETRHMEREVNFNGYHRKAESDWTAPTFSALLGTGLDVRPCDSFVFGPVLWLDWTAMWRPSVEEDGGRAADLKLDAATYQSLRSSLGARMNVRLHEGPDAARLAGSLDLSLTAVWNHEFLYDNGATTARFAHFGSTSFTDRADVSDRDTFGGMLQLTGHLTENVTLSLFGGLEQGPKTSDAHGGASLVWSF